MEKKSCHGSVIDAIITNRIGIYQENKCIAYDFMIEINKVGGNSWGQPEGSLFNSYYLDI